MGALLAKTRPSERIIVALWVALLILWRRRGRKALLPQTPTAEPETAFYMNFKIVNFEDAFPILMKSKVEEKSSNKVVKAAAGQIASRLASKPHVAHNFSEKITNTLCAKLPEAFGDMGVQVEFKRVYSSYQWIVLRAEVREVDIPTLLRSEKVDKGNVADKIEPLVSLANKYTALPTLVRGKFQSTLKEKLEKKIPAKMWKKVGFKVLLVNKSSSEQAEFFFDTILPAPITVEYKILSRREDLRGFVGEQWKSKLGGGVVGAGMGKVAGALSQKVPDKFLWRRFGKKSLLTQLLLHAQFAGIDLTLLQQVVGEDGQCAINLNIHHVDTATLGVPAHGGIYFRLSHKLRSEVLDAACERLEKDLSEWCNSKTLNVELRVHKGHKSSDVLDLEMSDDDDDLEPPPGV